MRTEDLLTNIHDAIAFITRSTGVPKRVVADAAQAATEVILKHMLSPGKTANKKEHEETEAY